MTHSPNLVKYEHSIFRNGQSSIHLAKGLVI